MSKTNKLLTIIFFILIFVVIAEVIYYFFGESFQFNKAKNIEESFQFNKAKSESDVLINRDQISWLANIRKPWDFKYLLYQEPKDFDYLTDFKYVNENDYFFNIRNSEGIIKVSSKHKFLAEGPIHVFLLSDDGSKIRIKLSELRNNDRIKIVNVFDLEKPINDSLISTELLIKR